MANRKISLEIGAKSKLRRDLNRIGGQLKAFGKRVAGVMRGLAVGAIAATAAIVGIGAKAVKAWAVQETAVINLRSALRAYGEETDETVKAMENYASQIQKETAVGDEVSISRMARLRQLGVERDMLGQAAKGVVALTQAGMGEEQAVKAIAAARMGEFTLLQRYIPELRTANDETEKARILNAFLTRQYQSSKDELNTVAGAWRGLTGVIGDAWEAIGKTITENFNLAEATDKARDKIIDLTKAWADFVGAGGISQKTAEVKLLAESFRYAFTLAKNYAVGFVKGGLVEPIKQGLQYITSNMMNLSELLRKLMTGKFSEAKSYAVALQNSLKGMEVDESTAWKDMLEKNEANSKKNAENIEKINADMLDAMRRRREGEKGKGDADPIEEIDVAAPKDSAEEINKLQDQIIAKEEELQELEARRREEAENKALQKEIDDLDQIIAKNEKIAKMKVEEFIAAKQAGKEEEKQAKREADRARRLGEKVGRGIKLSREDKEWLEARNAIAKANADADADRARQKKLQEAMERRAQQDSGNLQATRIAVESLEKDMAELLRAK